MKTFSQRIIKIGINPNVVPPEQVLRTIQRQVGKERGPIPVMGTLNGAEFKQTLVKYQGKWRLYINGPMLKASGLKTGDIANVKIIYDPKPRIVPMHRGLAKALSKNRAASAAFEKLAPHRKKEINRYLASLKSEEAVDRSITHVLAHLLGKKAPTLGALMRKTKR